MLCADCQKKDAELFYKEIVNNQVAQRALCSDCAQKAALTPAAANALLLEFLAGLGGLTAGSPSRQAARCTGCGLRYAQFRETGRLGCAECYRAFQVPLANLLRRVHGSDRHQGKLPRTAGESRETARREEELDRLREELARAIAGQRFEDAASLRDRIHRLQSQG